MAALFRNLAAGARLALFMPVRSTAFRISLGSLLALIAFGFLLNIAIDAIRTGPGATFNLSHVPIAVLGPSLSLAALAVIAVALGQPSLAVAAGVALLAAFPVVEVLGSVYEAFLPQLMRTRTQRSLAWAAWFVLTAWGVAITVRVFLLMLVPRPRYFPASVAAAVTLLLGVSLLHETWFGPGDWWHARSDRDEGRDAHWSVVTEQALLRQPQLLAAAIDAIPAHRPGVADVYFVGFAPYASQKVFERDVRAARSVAGEAFDIEQRSTALVSSPDSVLEVPIATASNLRAVLKRIGAQIDRDEDVVMLFLTSHGSADHRLAVQFYPLQLDSVDPVTLNAMLDEAGIRWRIVVISACYSGGFIPALANDTTIVMTAAAADRTSFGCSNDSEMTYFTDALFNQALRAQPGLLQAFDRARTLVSERERAEGLEPPSDPQIHVGAAMREKLAQIERGGSRSACAASPC